MCWHYCSDGLPMGYHFIKGEERLGQGFLEESRKIRFRENIPVDPNLCAQTVLYFPYDRCVNGRTLIEVQKDDSKVVDKIAFLLAFAFIISIISVEERSTTADKLQIYDPVFILRFSIRCLSMGYIESTEFASLGLLAITFVSMSSPDDNMRKLGYEALANFKGAIEKCKKKHVAPLRLLLLYVQNGIEEQWQRIPSIIAVFIAEASLVLSDPSHENYSTIRKYLMNSSCVNMKTIPLFENFFWSGSVSFRNDRLWILRLLYAGLNVEDDAQIYIQNFEKIFGFYSSPLSDNDSQELIIQIVKKAVKLHKLAWYLVEHCGLILWLSSIVSSLCWSEFEDRKRFLSSQLPIIAEVLNAIILPGKIVEWLQKHVLEQLSELSSHLYKLLVGGGELITEQTSVGNSFLQLLTFVLTISQKRKIYQPHFTLTETGLFQLCEAIDVCSKTSCDLSMVLGLEVVLMSAPPVNIPWNCISLLLNGFIPHVKFLKSVAIGRNLTCIIFSNSGFWASSNFWRKQQKVVLGCCSGFLEECLYPLFLFESMFISALFTIVMHISSNLKENWC